jgi:hypothetical protein
MYIAIGKVFKAIADVMRANIGYWVPANVMLLSPFRIAWQYLWRQRYDCIFKIAAIIIIGMNCKLRTATS